MQMEIGVVVFQIGKPLKISPIGESIIPKVRFERKNAVTGPPTSLFSAFSSSWKRCWSISELGKSYSSRKLTKLKLIFKRVFSFLKMFLKDVDSHDCLSIINSVKMYDKRTDRHTFSNILHRKENKIFLKIHFYLIY